jgi:hypothetical protein
LKKCLGCWGRARRLKAGDAYLRAWPLGAGFVEALKDEEAAFVEEWMDQPENVF